MQGDCQLSSFLSFTSNPMFIKNVSQWVFLPFDYAYDAWGKPYVFNSDGTINNDYNSIGHINPFRYRSYYYDEDTGLYYLKSRYYDPEIGHFISPDDAAYLSIESLQGLNLYSYCKYNPIVYYDPTGHFVLLALLCIVTAAYIASKTVSANAEGAINPLAPIGIEPFNIKDKERFINVSTDILATLFIFDVGITTFLMTANPFAGALTTILTSQTINAIYYNWFANSNSSFLKDSYSKDQYMTRWDRLDYMKTKFWEDADKSYYDFNKMRYYGEYSLHMYGYYTIGQFALTDSLKAADVKLYQWDNDHDNLSPVINILSIILGLFGG